MLRSSIRLESDKFKSSEDNLTISSKSKLISRVPEAGSGHVTPVSQSARRFARRAMESLSAVRPKHWDALRLSFSHSRRFLRPSAPNAEHLRAVMHWLINAQDATGSDGVSWGYRSRAAIRS